MHLLVLGGTRFLGKHLVEAALAAHHTVTLFNRGQTSPELFPATEKLRGDRTRDLSTLAERRWDAVIDTSGYVPRVVGASARALANAAERYIFISSISVYADFNQPSMDENAPVGTLADESVELITNETYGPLKALCEGVVEEAFPGRALIVRPGYIVGPDDLTDRFTYWPHRVALGGEVLAPGDPDLPVQFVDVRDLAEWIIRMVEQQGTGVYNATGPDSTLSMGRFLAECKQETDSDAHFTWVSEEFLEEYKVELPIWVPTSEPGGATVDCRKAIEAGLTFRLLSETIGATLAWDRSRPPGYKLIAGITREQEQELLRTWHTHMGV